MENLNLPVILDIIILVFLFLSVIVGYFRGFSTRFISFILTIFSVMMAYMLSNPISLMFTWKITGLDGLPTEVIRGIYPILYRVIAFVVLLVVFYILKVLIMLIFKSTIKKMIESFSLTQFIDRILGGILGLIQGVIITFVVLCIIATPIVKNGAKTLKDSTLGYYVINLVPSVNQQLKLMNDTYSLIGNMNLDQFSLNNLDAASFSTFTSIIDNANKLGLFKDEDIVNVFESYASQIETMENVVVTKEEMLKINELLDIPALSAELKDKILNKLIVE